MSSDVAQRVLGSANSATFVQPKKVSSCFGQNTERGIVGGAQIYMTAVELSSPRSSRHGLAAKKHSRHTLILEDDMARVVAAIEAVDEHSQGSLDFAAFQRMSRLLGVEPDRRAFLRGCVGCPEGPRLPVRAVLALLFPSYSIAQVMSQSKPVS